MRRGGSVVTFFWLFLAAGLPAAAQSSPGLLGYGSFGSTSFAASDSFDAVADASSRRNVGGGAVVTGLWRGIFVDVGFSQSKVEGQRVFLHDGTVYDLGIPLEVAVAPIDVAAGWRLTRGRFSPYAGAGVTSLSYKETSDSQASGDELNVRKTGPLALAGLDVRLVKWIQVGAEVRYRAVEDILGSGGVSASFGEDDAGGLSAGVRFSVGK